MEVAKVSRSELIELAAVDSEFYCRTFFPKTVRQPFAPMHHDAWAKLESDDRQVNLLMFRGSGKTSHCRLYTSKSVAYGISRTILYTGKSEGHAIKSTSWLRSNVEHNQLWTSMYNIRPGSKWQDTEFEIIVGKGSEEVSIWVMAAGIFGSIRGINRDDYRPDLIVLDDVLDDENASSKEQREKVENLVYGALLESLAPASDSPHAKLIALNTPQNREDFAVKALKDPSWLSAVYGCWTKETAEFPVDFQESAWPERFPTEQLRAEKRSAAARNMLSTNLREKECKLVSPETASFKLSWLQKYSIEPEKFAAIYAIDPVPPPSERAIIKGNFKTDFEAHVVWGALGDKRFLLDYALMRGHEPTWTIKTFFEMQRKWRPLRTLVETVAYQRVLMFLLKQAMQQARRWYAIEEYQDKRSKYVRIVTAHNGPASEKRLFVKNEHTDFTQAFGTYPDVTNDDLLDASAIALSALEGFSIGSDGEYEDMAEISKYEPIIAWGAP